MDCWCGCECINSLRKLGRLLTLPSVGNGSYPWSWGNVRPCYQREWPTRPAVWIGWCWGLGAQAEVFDPAVIWPRHMGRWWDLRSPSCSAGMLFVSLLALCAEAASELASVCSWCTLKQCCSQASSIPILSSPFSLSSNFIMCYDRLTVVSSFYYNNQNCWSLIFSSVPAKQQ